jgi:hypothetical protein
MKRKVQDESSSSRRRKVHPATVYAAEREISLRERQTLPKKFQDPEYWPVDKILEERGRRYLVEWKEHPRTGEIWKPQWVREVEYRAITYNLTAGRSRRVTRMRL